MPNAQDEQVLVNSPEKEPSDLVKSIPGNMLNSSQLKINVRSYAGLAPFNYGFNGELFYWFFKSQSVVVRPKSEIWPKCNNEEPPDQSQLAKTPLLIWINGGPGGSSELGLFCENGPFRIQNDAAATIVPNPNSWNQKAHVIYWDQPVWTGFSRSESLNPKKYATSEEALSKQFYQALQAFYDRHPEYRPCKLYITGESYAGKYIPHIATEIVQQNKTSQNQLVNLAGLAIGDGWMDPRRQLRWVIDYAFNLGFLDTVQKQVMEEKWQQFNELCNNNKWAEATDAGNCLNDDILACGGRPDVYDVRHWTDPTGETLEAYMNADAVKQALHLPSDAKWITADDAGPVTEALNEDIMKDTTTLFPPLLEEVDEKGDPKYRLLFYTGNFDMSACGFTGTEKILQELKWKDQEEWRRLKRRVWVTPPSATNGFVKSFANLTQMVIPDAGHLVPINKPVISREMLYTWLFNNGEYPGYDPLKYLKG